MADNPKHTILGSGGSVGIELAKALRKYTQNVRLVSRNPVAVHPDDELFPADLTNPEQLSRALKDSDVAYLTVGFAYKTRVWEKTWPPLMHSLVQLCGKQGTKLVFFDNMYMYDPAHLHDMKEGTPVQPCSKKGHIRAAVADVLLKAIEREEVDGLIARAADFYGPKLNNSILIEMVFKNLKKGKKGLWLCSEDKLHNFTYTPDAGLATAMLGNTPSAYGQVWHLPTSRPLQGKAWVEAFSARLKVPAKTQVISKWIVKGMGLFNSTMKEMTEMLYQWDRDYVFNSTKIEEAFNIKPTPIESSIEAIVHAD
jgi:nucleoside-diphosphate-sugar epimerase